MKNFFTKQKSNFILGLLGSMTMLFFFSCKLKYPPLLPGEAAIETQLKYAYKTDQKDRRRILFKLIVLNSKKMEKDPKILKVSDRDSIRLKKIIELAKQNSFKSSEAKFFAASIYNHGGGIKMKNDSSYYHSAYSLFRELYDKGYKTSITKSLMNDSHYKWQSYFKK